MQLFDEKFPSFFFGKFIQVGKILKITMQLQVIAEYYLKIYNKNHNYFYLINPELFDN